MDEKDNIKKYAQQIFESAHDFDLEPSEIKQETLAETIDKIQYLSLELQRLVGNPTTIQYIGYNPTLKEVA